MKNNHVTKDQLVLLYSDRKKWLLKAHNQLFHTHQGIIDLTEIIGKPYGSKITSSLNYDFYILKPTLHDILMKIRRPTQILYPKDIGLILIKLGITSGKRILEIGTGSASLTISMASMVQPEGHIYSYERRESFSKVAQKNLSLAGVARYVDVTNNDASQGIYVRDMDAAVIDIGDPWTVLEPVTQALKPGSSLASFSPTINQIEKTVEMLLELHYVDLETIECLVREYSVRTGKTRPKTTMIAHTGYLTFARKTT